MLSETQPLDAQEIEIVQALWSAVKNDTDVSQLSTNDIVRYVRAFVNDDEPTTMAIERLKATLAWRREINFTKLVQDRGPPRHARYNELLPLTKYGHDEHGHPVVGSRLCEQDLEKLAVEFSVEDVAGHEAVRNNTCMCVCDAAQEKHGRRVYKVVMVIDLAGLSFSTFSQYRAYLQRAVWVGTEHWPESTHSTVFVNAPWIFSACWKVLQRWLHPRTVERVVVLGTDPAKTREAMLELGIQRESLPEWCGEGTHVGVQFL